MVPVVPIV